MTTNDKLTQWEDHMLNEYFRRLESLEKPIDPDWYDDGDKYE